MSADLSKIKSFSFEMGPIRPPSEGGAFSLLVRVTRNCPWSRCTFCYARFYNRQPFQVRPVAEVKADIDTIKMIADELSALSWQLGYNGNLGEMGRDLPGLLLGGKTADALSADEAKSVHCVINVFNWLAAGGKSVFLQDADSLILHTGQLLEIVKYIKDVFPGIERVTSYARSKSIGRKKPEELKLLREAGLTRLHIGLETGDDELLARVDKGVSSEEHINAGQKAMAAGYELSLYVMPGLGGRAFWRQHAINTARVLSAINPTFIRMRPFVPMEGTPLLEDYKTGEFELTTPHERLREIRLLVENLNVTSRVSFDQITNTSIRQGSYLIPLFKKDYDGYKFPEEKTKVLELIDEGLRLDERAFQDIAEWAGTRTI